MTTRRHILVSGAMPDVVDALLSEMRKRGFAPSLHVVGDEPQYRSALLSQNWDAVIAEENQALPIQNALKILQKVNKSIPFIVVNGSVEVSKAIQLIRQGVRNVLPRTKTSEICDAIDQEIIFEAHQSSTHKPKELFMIAESIFNSEAEAIMLTDSHHRIKMVNKAFSRITGFESEDILGMRPDFLESGCQDIDFFENFWKQVNSNGNWQGEVWYQRKNGEAFPAWLSMTNIKSDNGVITHYMAIFRDITNNKRFEEEIIRQASYDALTDLPNRTLFFDRLRTTTKQARRSKQKFAVLFMDLDRFKEINDKRGHAVGDILLKEVALRLIKSVRDSDTVARLGGDEFAVIISEINDLDAATLVANKIIQNVSEPFLLSGEQAEVGVSIGISVYPKDGADEETLLGRADIAMYQAKNAKKGHCFYEAGMSNPNAETTPSMNYPSLGSKNKKSLAMKMKISATLMVMIGIGLLSWAAINYPAVPLAILDLANFNTASGTSDAPGDDK